MTLRELMAGMVAEGDMDKPVHVRIVTRNVGSGTVKSARLVKVDRFCRMHFSVWLEGNYVVIEQDELDNAKEDLP